MKKEIINILTEDQVEISLTKIGDNRDQVLVIQSATGVHQNFYHKFATEVASRGLTVITFDYRGIGLSKKEKNSKESKATMTDWAIKDIPAVHQWINKNYPNSKISILGHSFGGQTIGLLPNEYLNRINKILLVASQNGYWNYFALKNRPSMLLNWYLLMPLLNKTLGYFPLSKLVGGEDLPLGVANQWRRWCLSPDYLFVDFSDPKYRENYKKISAPIFAYDIRDDEFASGVAVQKLIEFYPTKNIKIKKISPKDYKVKKIGHFGPFKPQFKDTLWKEFIEYLV